MKLSRGLAAATLFSAGGVCSVNLNMLLSAGQDYEAAWWKFVLCATTGGICMIYLLMPRSEES